MIAGCNMKCVEQTFKNQGIYTEKQDGEPCDEGSSPNISLVSGQFQILQRIKKL